MKKKTKNKTKNKTIINSPNERFCTDRDKALQVYNRYCTTKNLISEMCGLQYAIFIHYKRLAEGKKITDVDIDATKEDLRKIKVELFKKGIQL